MVSRSQRVCRLCEFPAADGGVPLDALDADKWAEWCRRELGLETIGGAEEAEHTLICKYCIWEARTAHESSHNNWSENEKGCDWWTGHDDDHFFREYFYKKPVIRPCKVVMEKFSSDFDQLALEDVAVRDCHRSDAHLEGNIQACQTSAQVEKQLNIKSADGKSTTKIFQCSVCQIIFYNKSSRERHIKSIHKNVVRCRSFQCSTYFLTEDERKQHEQKFHVNGATNKTVKCIYCGALLTSKTLNHHTNKQHIEAIKCDFNHFCPNYFHTESEKKEHIFNAHTQGLEHKSTPVKCIYCDKIYKGKFNMHEHVYKIHNDVRIKCRQYGCAVFFLSQNESDEHFLQKHQHADSRKKWQCPKCSYVASVKNSLLIHLQRVHVIRDSTKLSFKCPQCPKYFPAKLNLTVHIKRVHAGRCTCQFCGKTMLKSSKRRHLLVVGACKPIPNVDGLFSFL